jgi:hypothetical protein
MNVLKGIIKISNVIIIIALLAIHFIFKESSYKASLYFYTFPLPIIIIIILLLSIFIGSKFRKYNFILAAVLLIIWLSKSFKINLPEDINNKDLEVVFWNASHSRNFQDAFHESKDIPDVVVLVEYHGEVLNETKLQYPNFHFYKDQIEEVGIFSKTPIHIKKTVLSKYKSTIICFETNGINFYAVDVSASIDVPRNWELGFVEKSIKETKNTIVLGDFNVPYESKYLNSFKTNFNNAFNEKGNGFRETWFWNIPLLSLDHIWVSKDLKILKTQKISTFKSDHSMIKTYIKN